MATLTDAQVRPAMDQKWDLAVLQARYGGSVITDRILNKSAIVEESGEIVNITVKPRVVGGVVGADGGFTSETFALTNVQVNVNTWRYVGIDITFKQGKQALINLETELPKQFGERLGELQDIDLADLFTGFTGGSMDNVPGQGIGSPGKGVNFLIDEATLAVALTRRRNIPMEDMSWILSSEAFYVKGWLSQERVTSAMHLGESKSLLTTGKGYKLMILGIPAFESTLLDGTTAIDDSLQSFNGASAPNLPGTTACALIHKEALGVAMQFNTKKHNAEGIANHQLANIVVAHSLYGVRSVRATHGFLIYVSNS